MAIEEIIYGLRNAIERGYSLEQAKQSFINAGFGRDEVESAAASLGGAMTKYPIPYQQPMQPQSISQPPRPTLPPPMPQISQTQSMQPKPMIRPLPQTQASYQQPRAGPRKGLIITLIVILVALLIILGLSFVFKNQIIAFFTGS